MTYLERPGARQAESAPKISRLMQLGRGLAKFHRFETTYRRLLRFACAMEHRSKYLLMCDHCGRTATITWLTRMDRQRVLHDLDHVPVGFKAVSTDGELHPYFLCAACRERAREEPI